MQHCEKHPPFSPSALTLLLACHHPQLSLSTNVIVSGACNDCHCRNDLLQCYLDPILCTRRAGFLVGPWSLFLVLTLTHGSESFAVRSSQEHTLCMSRMRNKNQVEPRLENCRFVTLSRELAFRLQLEFLFTGLLQAPLKDSIRAALGSPASEP